MSSEFTDDRSDRLVTADLQFARRMLDYDIKLAPSHTFAEGSYDEQRAIYDDVIGAREYLRASLLQTASNVGLEIDDAEVAAWVPNEAQLDLLKERLAPQRKRLRMIDGIAQFAADQQNIAQLQGVPLRGYQREAVAAFEEFLTYATRDNEQGGKSGIIEMPTGTGKTGIFANIAAQLKYGEQPHEPIRVLVLVPTQTILDQTVGLHGERGFGKFAPHLDVGAYYQDEKDLNSEVVVMTTASFNRLMSENKMPHFDTVVVDEAHTVIAEKTANRIKDYCADKIAIGLTATPEYDEERSAYNVFKHQIYQMKFPDAVHSGKLAPIRGHLKNAEPELNLIHLPKDPIERHRALRAARMKARFLEAEKIIKSAIERGLGVIVRCPAGDDINLAVTFSDYLRDQLVKTGGGGTNRWINADFVGGSPRRQDPEFRKRIIEDFDNGDSDVLFYVKALGMGWDSPHAKVLVNLAPTTSAVEMRQAIGRTSRLIVHPDGTPVEAEVYDFRDPDLKNQYTCLDALETKSGELLGHQQTDKEAPIPVSRRFRRETTTEILGVIATTLGEITIGHNEDAALPDGIEVSAVIKRMQKEKLPLNEACRILGVSLPTLRGILSSVGSNPSRDINTDELMIMLDLYPKLNVETVPSTGYNGLRELADQLGFYVRPLSLLHLAKNNGFEYYKFRSQDGTEVGYYFKTEDGPRLIALAEDKLSRKIQKKSQYPTIHKTA
jgi:superfamily II DNA or RNA helicase